MQDVKTIIISPSGNFYGSEQVLCDFLKATTYSYLLYVPENSLFYSTLKDYDLTEKHQVMTFNPNYLKSFYFLRILIHLLGKYNRVYINEGGHSKYIGLLSRLFPNKKFYQHIRIIEDTRPKRLGKLKENNHLITISKFLSGHLCNYSHSIVYDPYDFKTFEGKIFNADQKLKVGIVGRVSMTKRIDLFEKFIIPFSDTTVSEETSFHLYGDIMEENNVLKTVQRIQNMKNVEIIFHGFMKGEDIYSNIDVLLHFNDEEPLGRVFFESLSAGIPFVGFHSGGVGELAKIFDLEKTMVSKDDEDRWVENIGRTIKYIKDNYKNCSDEVKLKCKQYKELFEPVNYCKSVENVVLNKQCVNK